MVEYYLAIKKMEILPFVTTWMDLEGIMLREMCQTEKDKYCMYHLYIGCKSFKNLELIETEQNGGCQSQVNGGG